jgi:hypothetical protein
MFRSRLAISDSLFFVTEDFPSSPIISCQEQEIGRFCVGAAHLARYTGECFGSTRLAYGTFVVWGAA